MLKIKTNVYLVRTAHYLWSSHFWHLSCFLPSNVQFQIYISVLPPLSGLELPGHGGGGSLRPKAAGKGGLRKRFLPWRGVVSFWS